jgi:glycogen operon protein
LSGSSDLYESGERRPHHSINFITSHDGFTLNDLVTYNDKHNEANGEGNRDGDNNNHSYNYGVEGPTRRKSIQKVRQRQIKNQLATLFLSQGVPMMLFGDECRRTQQGNNNVYCQDNDIAWFDWQQTEKNSETLRFTQALIHFRRNQPTVRHRHFLRGEPTGRRGLRDVNWYDACGKEVDWNDQSDRALICILGAKEEPTGTARDVLILINAGAEPRPFTLPRVARGGNWRLFVDTAAEAPDDIFPTIDGPAPPANGQLTMIDRSLRCYVSTEPAKPFSREP